LHPKAEPLVRGAGTEVATATQLSGPAPVLSRAPPSPSEGVPKPRL